MDVERHKDHRFTKAIDHLYKHGILLSVSPLSGEFDTDDFAMVYQPVMESVYIPEKEVQTIIIYIFDLFINFT